MKTNLEILIQRVEEIDFNAAKFMKDNLHWMDDDFRRLSWCFPWAETPQGYDYWYDIAYQLGEV